MEQNQIKAFVGDILAWSQTQPDLRELSAEQLAFEQYADRVLDEVASTGGLPKHASRPQDSMEFGKEVVDLAVFPLRFAIILWATFTVIRERIPERWKEHLVKKGLSESEADQIVKRFLGELASLCPGTSKTSS